jgi:methylthioribose-1-phosphate isomerase
MANPMNQSTPDTRPTIGITMTATDSHPTARRADTLRTTEPTAANVSKTTRTMINLASSGSGSEACSMRSRQETIRPPSTTGQA